VSTATPPRISGRSSWSASSSTQLAITSSVGDLDELEVGGLPEGP
jgi:hypothetical protein